MYIVRLVGKLKKGNTVVLNPELESITIEPSIEEKTYTPTKYGFSQVTCRGVNLQTKEINPTIGGRTVIPDSGYVGLSEVEINPIPLQVKAVNPEVNSISVKPDYNYAGLSEVIVNSPNLQEKNVNPTTSKQTITADSHYLALSKVIVNPVNLQSKEVNPTNQSQTITADNGYVGLSEVIVNSPSLQSKEVNPTTSVQTITADNDYNGLSRVQINAVTSSIDNNIQSSNIKNGVNILGVTGSYKGEKYAPKYISFYQYQGNDLSEELANIDTSNITSMRSMFDYCEYLTELDLSNFDTSKVTSFQMMFNRCVRLQKLNLSSFDTSSATIMRDVVSGLWGLQEITFGANWITPNVSETYSQIGGTWTNQTTGVSYSGLNALIEAGKTEGALTGTWKKS